MPCFNFAHTSSNIILHNISYSFLSLTVIEGFRNQYIGEITLFVTLAFPCFSTFQLGPVNSWSWQICGQVKSSYPCLAEKKSCRAGSPCVLNQAPTRKMDHLYHNKYQRTPCFNPNYSMTPRHSTTHCSCDKPSPVPKRAIFPLAKVQLGASAWLRIFSFWTHFCVDHLAIPSM